VENDQNISSSRSQQKIKDTAGEKKTITIILKAILLLILSLAILWSLHSSYFKKLSPEDIQSFQQMIKASGKFAFLFFFAITAALVAIGFPRLVLCACAGAMFGFWYGIILVQFATLFGSFVPFMAARLVSKTLIEKFGSKIKAIMNIVEKGGTTAVVIARQLPITGGILNLLLGLTPIKKKDFAAGTFIGTLPEAVPATMLGNSFSCLNFQSGLYNILISVILLIFVWLFTWFLTKFWRKSENTIKT
jgi:uncharacterized membrane protein YdjX (TVP38/TMEM64 family)